MPDVNKPLFFRNPDEENEIKSYHMRMEHEWYEMKIGFKGDDTVIRWYKKKGYRRVGCVPDGWNPVDEPVKVGSLDVIPRR